MEASAPPRPERLGSAVSALALPRAGTVCDQARVPTPTRAPPAVVTPVSQGPASPVRRRCQALGAALGPWVHTLPGAEAPVTQAGRKEAHGLCPQVAAVPLPYAPHASTERGAEASLGEPGCVMARGTPSPPRSQSLPTPPGHCRGNRAADSGRAKLAGSGPSEEEALCRPFGGAECGCLVGVGQEGEGTLQTTGPWAVWRGLSLEQREPRVLARPLGVAAGGSGEEGVVCGLGLRKRK